MSYIERLNGRRYPYGPKDPHEAKLFDDFIEVIYLFLPKSGFEGIIKTLYMFPLHVRSRFAMTFMTNLNGYDTSNLPTVGNSIADSYLKFMLEQFWYENTQTEHRIRCIMKGVGATYKKEREDNLQYHKKKHETGG